MIHTAKPMLARRLSFGVFACVAVSWLALSAPAQTRTPRTSPTTAHAIAKSHAASEVKNTPRATAINAEELQHLLKRDGNRPLLVNFWATWCDLCREEFPDLVKIDNEYKDKGLDFIAITLDDLADMNTEVPKFLGEVKATMPVYLLNVPDPDPPIHSVDPSWTGAMPATFLYNSKGEIVYKQLGRIKPDELRAAINKLVSSKQ